MKNNENMLKISVVIPCFNGWRFMGKCLTSLETQTILPYEVIIVDDCSSDNSFESLSKFVNNSSINIVLERNSVNSGPGVTRKNAIQMAKGDYIAFCDCDDWYEPTFIEDFMNKIKESNADIIICDNYVVTEKKKYIDGITNRLINKNKNEILALYKMSMWRCGIRRELFSYINDVGGYYAEDGLTIVQLIMKANKIDIINKPLYNYYCRTDSASNKPNPKAYYEMVDVYKIIEKLLINDYHDECIFLGVKYICYSALLNGFKSNISLFEIRKCITEFTQKYPDWISNKYVYSLGKFKRLFLVMVYLRLFTACKLLAKLHSFVINKR